MYEFPCSGPINTDAQVTSGLLHVTAEPRDTVEVTVRPAKDNENGRAAAEAVKVEMAGDTLVITTPTNRGLGFIRRSGDVIITVRVPSHSTLEVRAASADLVFQGTYAQANVKCASSDMRLDHVSGALVFDAASGDCEIGSVGGEATLQSASGDIRCDTIGGDAHIRTASGDVTIGFIGGSASAHSASGDIRIGSLVHGEGSINSASGDVRVGVAPGTAVWLDLNTMSGDSRSELTVTDEPPAGVAPTLNLRVRTASGDITVTRAPRAASRPVESPVLQD
jgi:DUF4097 and DUF4098 domain-containing protein YvlB